MYCHKQVKWLVLPLLAALALVQVASAQEQILVEEVIKEMSKGTLTGYEMTIPEVTYKGIKKDLARYLRKGSRSRAEEAQGEMVVHGAVFSNISPDPFHVYVKHLEMESGVRLTVYFSPDDTIFYSAAMDGERATAIMKYLRDFGIEQYRQVVKSELESQKRKLKELEGHHRDHIKKQQKFEKKISESRRAISDHEKKIEQSLVLDSLKLSEIYHQKEIVSRLRGTGGEEEKLAGKRLKSLEKEYKGLGKSREKRARTIDGLWILIEDHSREIGKHQNLEDERKKEIDTQKEKVKEIEIKLNRIR